jgi:hypothetical protein
MSLTFEEEIFLVLFREDSSAAAITKNNAGVVSGFRLDENEIDTMRQLAKKISHVYHYGMPQEKIGRPKR